MTGIATAWAAWTQFHAAHGFAIESFLNPPATEADLAAIETETGYHLPGDLRELWRHADGQPDSYRIASPAPGAVISPVFGSYDFMRVRPRLRRIVTGPSSSRSRAIL